MRSWSIGEVARLLGVKTHIIRYWESELPLLSPRKSLSGRRAYSSRDIQLLMKLKHLLYEERYTIEGARKMLWEELGKGTTDVQAKLSEMRSDLIEALMTAQRGGSASPARSPEKEPGEGIRERFSSLGQGHLFDGWEKRPGEMRRRLLEDLGSLDEPLLASLTDSLRRSPRLPSGITPAPFVPLGEIRADAEAKSIGEDLVRRGKTAFLTVAGGQGSRLGFEGPKGMFRISPIRGLTLFAIFAEKLLAARRWYGAEIPWLIMTSPQNSDETKRYFEGESYFGLGAGSVHFFNQGVLPSLTPDGGLVMGADGGLFFNPNGHGGVVEGLRRSGLLDAMMRDGVEELFYFQIDNPLATVPDPAALGFHRRAGSELTSKVIAKAYPEEKLGVIGIVDDLPVVIEYSDIDAELRDARDSSGRLRFSMGSIAIHIFNVAFLAKPSVVLPYHLARKNVEALNPTAEGAEIVVKEAIKLETFVFDCIPLAHKALFIETDRAEEFAPLKNKEGVDSAGTCIKGQVEKHARWLSRCGVHVPRDASGAPCHAIEISPLFALDAEVLSARRGLLKDSIDEDTLLV